MRSVGKDKMRFFAAMIVSELKDTANDNTTISIFCPRISCLSSYDLIKKEELARKRQGDIVIEIVSAPN